MNTVLVALITGVLLAAAGLTLWRLMRGPSVLDRAAASDTLLTILLTAIGLTVVLGHEEMLSTMVTIAMVGILPSVAVARFLPRAYRRQDEQTP